MANRQRRYHTESATLEEFPEDLDDVYFHNLVIDHARGIGKLRNIIFKKIKEGVTERIKNYDIIPLEDTFTIRVEREVEIKGELAPNRNKSFQEFEWAVIREELIDRGLATEIHPDHMLITIERKITTSGPIYDPDESEDEEVKEQV
jgi:hypothetical protein